MTYRKSLLSIYLDDESGATAIEYGLIAALLALGIIAGASAIGGSINDLFGDVDGEISQAFGSDGGP